MATIYDRIGYYVPDSVVEKLLDIVYNEFKCWIDASQLCARFDEFMEPTDKIFSMSVSIIRFLGDRYDKQFSAKGFSLVYRLFEDSKVPTLEELYCEVSRYAVNGVPQFIEAVHSIGSRINAGVETEKYEITDETPMSEIAEILKKDDPTLSIEYLNFIESLREFADYSIASIDQLFIPDVQSKCAKIEAEAEVEIELMSRIKTKIASHEAMVSDEAAAMLKIDTAIDETEKFINLAPHTLKNFIIENIGEFQTIADVMNSIDEIRKFELHE